MPDTLHSVLLVVVMSAVVFFLRLAPFLIFRGKETPGLIVYLGKYLPYAIMGLLVVYCLRNTSIVAAPHGLPEAIALAITVGLQLVTKKDLVAIFVGTISYMFLVQVIFV